MGKENAEQRHARRLKQERNRRRREAQEQAKRDWKRVMFLLGIYKPK